MNKRAVLATSFALALGGASDARAAGDWSWPVRGPVITPYRNGDDPYAAGQHRGIDISAPVGTPVVAAVPGTVAFAGVVGSSGLTVAERTGDGRFELSYLHLSAASVHAGDRLDQGERLGAVGTSGQRSASEPHLHFGVREANDRHAYRDPLEFLPPAAVTRDPDPQPAPAPLPEPAPIDPAPAPAPAPAVGAPAGAVAAAPHVRLPAPLGLPALPRGAPHGSMPRTARFRGNAPGARVLPHARPAARGSDPSPGAVHAPAVPGAQAPVAPSRGPSVAPVRATPSSRVRPSSPRAGAHHGIDVGWLAACLGLVAAATLVARPRRSLWRLTARRALSSLGPGRDAAGIEGQ